MSEPNALDSFRRRYALRSPNARLIRNPSEAERLDETNGVRFLELAPATGVGLGLPPLERGGATSNRYLWIIDTRGVPYIFEQPIPALNNAIPKHTNLTGGAEAYMGGELWFTSESSMYLSGGSGRYPPVSVRQLEEAASAFKSFGYEVMSLGWDAAYDEAKRFLETTP